MNYMQHTQIVCIKFNSCLDKEVQTFTQFDSSLIVSHDQKSLIITNKRPIDNKKFGIFDADSSDCDSVDSKEDPIAREHIKRDHAVKHKEYKSKASCKLADITGFIYGGFSSRFWMLRKHINFMDYAALNHLPFYCWKCITL